MVVRLDRRQLVWINVTRHPTAEWIARQLTEAFPWDQALPHAGSGLHLWRRCATPIACHGHSRQAYRTGVALAERVCRTASERTGHWTKIRRPFALSSGSERSRHMRSSADFIIIITGFEFSVHTADRRAWQRALRPKPCRLVRHAGLRWSVAQKLALQWSPKQISGWLKRQFPADQGMQVSYETIYRSLFIQTRGVLKKELMAHLRTARQMRQAKGGTTKNGLGQIVDAVSIRERPVATAN